MNDIHTTLVLERSTKNKHLYVAGEKDQDILGNVYIGKLALPEPPPQTITVTIVSND